MEYVALIWLKYRVSDIHLCWYLNSLMIISGPCPGRERVKGVASRKIVATC